MRTSGFVKLFSVLLLLAACGCGAEQHSDMRDSKEDIYIKNLDKGNRVEVRHWARGICRDVNLRQIADALGTKPTVDAVVFALTSDFPDSTRQEAAEICKSELKRSKNSLQKEV